MLKMVLLRSISGAGKSYLAKKLYTEFFPDAVVCSADKYFMVGNEYCFDSTKLKDAHEWCRWQADQACKTGQIPIIDNTNTTYKEIEPYYLIAKKHGYKFEIQEPETPWKFNIMECYKRNTHNVPIETIQKMYDRWETTENILRQLADNY